MRRGNWLVQWHPFAGWFHGLRRVDREVREEGDAHWMRRAWWRDMRYAGCEERVFLACVFALAFPCFLTLVPWF